MYPSREWEPPQRLELAAQCRCARGDPRVGADLGDQKVPFVEQVNKAIELGVNDYLGKPYQDAQLLDAIQRRIDLSNVLEFTTEANPGTLTKDKLAVMKEGGINRISIGVQTFNEKALRLLGRAHSRQQAVAGFHMLREAGFEPQYVSIRRSADLSLPVSRHDRLVVLAAVMLGSTHLIDNISVSMA